MSFEFLSTGPRASSAAAARSQMEREALAARARIEERDGWRIAVTADALEVSGEGSPVTLLRALCQPAWESGVTAVRVRGEGAARAARSLGLPGIDYR